MIRIFHVSILLILLNFPTGILGQNHFLIIQNISRTYPSFYLKTRTVWLIPTPIAYESNKFSPDYGKTWEKPGMFGSNLRPYLSDNSDAKKDINLYTTFRILGISQMFVIAPLFLAKEIQWTNEYNRTGPPYEDVGSPGYIWGFLAFFYSGALTYHAISKVFLKNALKKYYLGKQLSSLEINKKFLPELGLGYNEFLMRPTFTLHWTF